MKEIYVVMGGTGEYSDRSEWPVVAFATEKEAHERIEALMRQYHSIPQEWHRRRWEHEEKMKEIMTLDPDFSLDYTGTTYYSMKVPFDSGLAG